VILLSLQCTLEREQEEENRRKEKDWTEREKYLDKHQAEFDEYKAKVETMPKEIEEAVKKAREKAIKETYRDEENKAKLLETEWEGKRKAFELKIESLNKTVDEQKARIVKLTDKLQTASEQIQELTMKAVSSAGQPKN
jgi:predicted  nucleic acid-binding Zn-ribbon protein